MPLYFVAILAPEEIDVRVREWKKYMLDQFGCKVALRSPAHITIIPPFHLPVEMEQDLLQLLKYTSSRQHKVSVSLKDFGTFKPRVIFVNVVATAELILLKTNVENIVFEAGYPIKQETRPFHPHITIANRDLRKADFYLAWKHFSAISYEASFDADNITLLRSEKDGWVIAGIG